MKKICIMASLALLAVTNVNAQARLGLIGGVNINNNLDHYQGETVSNQLKTGVHGGLLVDICLGKNWTLQPGLIYILKGGLQQRSAQYIGTDGMHDVKIKDKLSLHYIEMPLNFTYRIKAGTGHVFLGVGGYAAALVSGYANYKYKESVNGIDINTPNSEGTTSLNIGNDDGDDLHRWDAGVTGLLGYEFRNGFFLRGGVDVGMVDIQHDNAMGFAATQPATFTQDPTSKNISYLFSLGYFFKH